MPSAKKEPAPPPPAPLPPSSPPPASPPPGAPRAPPLPVAPPQPQTDLTDAFDAGVLDDGGDFTLRASLTVYSSGAELGGLAPQWTDASWLCVRDLARLDAQGERTIWAQLAPWGALALASTFDIDPRAWNVLRFRVRGSLSSLEVRLDLADDAQTIARGFKLTDAAAPDASTTDGWIPVAVPVDPSFFTAGEATQPANTRRLLQASDDSPWNRVAWVDVTGSGAELQLRDVTLESYERAVVIDVTGGDGGEVTAPPAPAAPPRTTAGASQTTLPPAAVSSLDLLPPPPPPPPSPTATPVIVDTSTDVASVWLLVGAPLAAGLLLALCAIVLVRRFGLGRGDPRERRGANVFRRRSRQSTLSKLRDTMSTHDEERGVVIDTGPAVSRRSLSLPPPRPTVGQNSPERWSVESIISGHSGESAGATRMRREEARVRGVTAFKWAPSPRAFITPKPPVVPTNRGSFGSSNTSGAATSRADTSNTDRSFGTVNTSFGNDEAVSSPSLDRSSRKSAVKGVVAAMSTVSPKMSPEPAKRDQSDVLLQHAAFRMEVDMFNASVGEGGDAVGQSGLFQPVHRRSERSVRSTRSGRSLAYSAAPAAAPEPTPPKLSPESNGRSIGGASLAKSSGLYKSSLAASEFGGGSYRPGVVMVSPAELAMALDEEYADDDDDEDEDEDEDDDIVFDRTLTNTSVASRLSRLTGVGEYFEMTPVEFDARIVLLEPLGQGAYGVVYRAALVNPASRDVAVKLLHRGGVGATNEQLGEFRREIDMLRGLDHPRIVKVLGACVQPPRMSIVQEFVDGGSLHEVLHNSQYDTVHDGANFGSDASSFGSEGSHGRVTKSKISFRAQLTVAVDIADAVDYLHNVCDPKVIHRDLKPQNVLVDVRGRAKLADFGIARRFRSTFLDTKNHAMGTLNYMAPCLFGDGKDVDISCDAYSFAMIAYEMFTGEEPWKTLSAMQIAMTVGVEGRRPKLPDSCPSDYAALIHACWSQDPNDRPDFRDVKRDLRDLREQVVWDDAVTAAGGKPARRERSMTLREAEAMNARLKVLREYRGSHESRSSQEDSSLILYEGTGEKVRDATPVIGSDSSVVLTVSESTPSESIELESVAEH